MHQEPDSHAIGHELRRRRFAMGVTQAELGTLLDVPSDTVAKWERGALNVRHERVLLLALDALEHLEPHHLHAMPQP